MYLGIQNGKIKFYTKTPLDVKLYNIDKVIETQDEYILDGEEYILNDEVYKSKKQDEELARINSLVLDSSTFYKEIIRTSGKTKSDIQTIIQSNTQFSIQQKENLLIDLQNGYNLIRGSFFVITIGTLLKYTSEDLNYLFEYKVFNF